MNIITDIVAWQDVRKQQDNQSIGFVHTMGHLHDGHLSLCTRSQQENDITVAAIFVNPTQFNQEADFANYPRTLASDEVLLRKQGVDYLLLWDEQTIYPNGRHVQVNETSELGQALEGEFRPGHLAGMLTVVLKYLTLVKPTRSYYGEKDYQQWLLIKKMAQALFLEIAIIACPTIRNKDGLALSSRNSRLTQEERQKVSDFPSILKNAETPELAIQQLEAKGFKVDYVVDRWERRLGAVWLGEVRLIDNQSLTELFR